jgi:hypothetical protein
MMKLLVQGYELSSLVEPCRSRRGEKELDQSTRSTLFLSLHFYKWVSDKLSVAQAFPSK